MSFKEVPSAFQSARVKVTCLECAERGEAEATIEADVVHPDPANLEDLDAATFKVLCPRCSAAFQDEVYVVVQILTGPQLDYVDGLDEAADAAEASDAPTVAGV